MKIIISCDKLMKRNDLREKEAERTGRKGGETNRQGCENFFIIL